MAWISWLMLTRDFDSISWYFLEQALPLGGGTNVVNVILVDFRGYDTFGEITYWALPAWACSRCWTGCACAVPSSTRWAGRGATARSR